MYAITLTWEQSNDALMWAIHNKAHLRMTVRLARDWMEMSSQFLEGELLKSLVVTRFPEPWTDRILAGQLLPCSFRRGHRKYLFVSAIVGHDEVEIDGKRQQAFVLAWPDGLQEMQRRHYFRASIPADYHLMARMWNTVPAIDHTPTTAPLATGRLVDVSAGGCQIETSRIDDIAVGNSYLVELELCKPEEPVLVLAHARRVDPTEDGRHRFGMQFLSLDHSPRGRETMLRLARFANFLRRFEPQEQHV